MTKAQRSLLVYAETRLVDYGGNLDCRHLNAEDRQQLEDWDDEGLLFFTLAGYQVRFSDRAWKLAHQYRRERAEHDVPTLSAEGNEQ